MKKKTKSKVYNKILLSFLGILFLIGTIGSARNIVTVLFGDKTEGIVIASEFYGSGKGGSRITKISYTDSDDNSYILEKVGQFQPIHNKGDVVTIYYDENNPNHGVEFSLFSLINLLACAMLLFFVILIMIKSSKEK